MNVEILTKEDLREFRIQLISDLKRIFQLQPQTPEKAWLKSSEVRKLLKISPNTLQSLRVGGKLKPTKVRGIFITAQKKYMLCSTKVQKERRLGHEGKFRIIMVFHNHRSGCYYRCNARNFIYGLAPAVASKPM